VRAVVDTNVLVSAVLNSMGFPAHVLDACLAGQFTLVTSEPLLDELTEVLSRPRIVRRHGKSPQQVAALVASLRELAVVVSVTSAKPLCRDPDDDIVIATAVEGQAEVVVSRDEDLTRDWEVVEPLERAGIRVLTVRRFLQELQEAVEREG
jgi:putative PIN family toxin of toxin-antitoxin system